MMNEEFDYLKNDFLMNTREEKKTSSSLFYTTLKYLTCLIEICIHQHRYRNTSQSTKWGTY
jgi:hypothetical protein